MNPEPIRVLFDGQCSVCSREARSLRRLDRGRGRIIIEDIAAPDFDPGRYGLTMSAVTGSIHGIARDGSVTTGMDVLRAAYRAVGHGWLLAWTAWWPFRRITDRFYAWFARNRIRLFGGTRCDDDRCAVSSPAPAPAARAGSRSAT